MLSINSILLPNGKLSNRVSDHNLLVVYAHPKSKQIFLLELDQKRQRKPKPYSFDEINYWLDEGLVSVAKLRPPQYQLQNEDALSESRKKKRDERFSIIEPIIKSKEEYYLAPYGKSVVRLRAEELTLEKIKVKTDKDNDVKKEVKPIQVHRLMYMWLAGGQTKNALLGDYSKVGIAAPSEDAQKIGAKRKNSPYTGKKVEIQDKKYFEQYLRKYILTRKPEKQKTLKSCHDKLLEDKYAEKFIDKHGDIKIVNWHPDRRPSINQFRYHARKFFKETGKYPSHYKKTPSVYAKDFAGRTGTAPIPTRPGEVYQIDETPFDAALIAEFFSSTEHRVGRATLYVVYDVFSNLIVGIYVTFRNPSWETMRQALLNAFLPKVTFCNQYGIHIEEDEWPYGVCGELLGDNAELVSGMSAVLEQHFNCTVKLTRGARGDDKGLVEGGFGVFKEALQGLLPGLVYVDEHDRGLTESRYRATLTLNDLYKVLITLALDRNKLVELSPDKLDRDMVRDEVIPRPIDLWRWGSRERGGPKYFSSEFIETHLQSRGTATVHQEGVFFQGRWYKSEWTLATGLQDQKSSGNRSPKFDCLYDDNCVDVITLVKDGYQYPAYLLERSRRFKGCSGEEAQRQLTREQYEKNSREPERTSGTSTTNARIAKVVESAIARRSKLSKSDIKHQNIRGNRAIVAQIETDSLAAAARKKQRPDLQNEPQEKPSRSSKKTTKTPRSKSDSGVNRALDDLMGENDND